MKKQALLIGINQYHFLSKLKYARQDAEAVKQALIQNYCFSDNEVLLLTDAQPGLLNPINRRVIEKHLEKLAGEELDLFIFGFWGHGLFRSGQRYFCAWDAISEYIGDLGLSFDALQRHLSNIRAKNTCLILDCCQKVHDRGDSDVFTAADQTVMENAARDIVLRRKEKEPEFVSNVAILNSCKEGQSAYEWDKREHGLFTAHLLDAMNRRYDSVSKIVSYINDNIGKTALELGKEQTPFYKLEGDIHLPVNSKSSPLVTGDVFISYRHCNADLVAPVEEELKKRGISYFIDRAGINYGMEYGEALTKAILASKLVLLIWTPEVEGSDDIVNEVTMALKAKRIVMPYKIGAFDQFDHPRLCYHLSSRSCYEVPQQTPETITELVNRIELALSGKAPVYNRPVIVLPEKSADAVIEKPEIHDIEIDVSYIPEPVEQKPIQTGAIQLPPLPQELLDLQSKNKGLLIAIEQLQSFSHESLAQANAALEQAQAQFQAWKERKRRLWKDMPQATREALERAVVYNPECTEKDVYVSKDQFSNDQYFDFLEQFQCAKKYEQAKRELQRVTQQRKNKCDEAVAKCQKKIEDNKELYTECVNEFFDNVIMTILAAMPGYDDLDASFPESQVLVPLRSLGEYGLDWRSDEIFSRTRELWMGNRPCALVEKGRIDNQERKNNQQTLLALSQPGKRAGERRAVVFREQEFTFRWCPPGTFTMGAPLSECDDDDDDDDDFNPEKPHSVKLTKGFWMMETETTVGMFSAFLNDTGYESTGNDPRQWMGTYRNCYNSSCSWLYPGFVQDYRHPVTCVSWIDAKKFCEWLSRKTGLKVDLPTEAQWEYACRARSVTTFFWGNVLNGDKANCNGKYPYGTKIIGKRLKRTAPVGCYAPNAWGLYDMHGNVYEWCQDWYGDYPDEGVVQNKGIINNIMSFFNSGADNSDNFTIDPVGPLNGAFRVYRGGAWNSEAEDCRSACRYNGEPKYRANNLGFRCVILIQDN